MNMSEEELRELAREVALILNCKLNASQIAGLLHIVFLDVNQAAKLLGVKPKTISRVGERGSDSLSQAHGKVIFLLSELLMWTSNDKHTRHRLTTIQGCAVG